VVAVAVGDDGRDDRLARAVLVVEVLRGLHRLLRHQGVDRDHAAFGLDERDVREILADESQPSHPCRRSNLSSSLHRRRLQAAHTATKSILFARR